jgi:hypothetical protein
MRTIPLGSFALHLDDGTVVVEELIQVPRQRRLELRLEVIRQRRISGAWRS